MSSQEGPDVFHLSLILPSPLSIWPSIHPIARVHSIPTLTPSSRQTLPPFRDAKKPRCAEIIHEFQIGGLLFIENVVKYDVAVATTHRKHVGRIRCIAGVYGCFASTFIQALIEVRFVLGGEHFSPSTKATCTRSGGEALLLFIALSAPFPGVHRGIVGEMVWCCLFAVHDPLTTHQITWCFLF
jgi:hypothetical protein